ncbi:MAG: hypothetical protein ACTSSH_00175 [Candidatus Heimdallarchaeota archaeon]
MKNNKWAKAHPEEANKVVKKIIKQQMEIKKELQSKRINEVISKGVINRKEERRKK